MPIKLLLVLLLCTMTHQVALWGQNTVGVISYNEELSTEGYHLIFPHNQSHTYLLDHCGRIVHSWPDEDVFVPGNAVHLLDNGNLVKCKRRQSSAVNDPIWAGGGGETVEIRSWDNDLISSITINDSTHRLHHDVAPLPNGNIVLLAWEALDAEEALAAGRNPLLLDQGMLWSEALFEWDPKTDSIVWEWHVTDHLIQDLDSNQHNYGIVSEHPELIDINFAEDGHPDWLHANAVDYNPVLDQLVLSIPSMNELWIIDHSTTTAESAGHTGGRYGRGGDLLYRWGNPQAYGQGDSTHQQLFFQHDVNWTHPTAGVGEEGFGQLIMFNNRVPGFRSTINIVQPPLDSMGYSLEGTRYGPQHFAGTWTHPDSLVIAVSAGLSSAQMLPNGNVLALSGRWGFAYEVTNDEQVVWEYRIPLKGGHPVNQGDTLDISNNITFRMERIRANHPAFVGRDLTPKMYLETNPDTVFCDLLTTTHDQLVLQDQVLLYPNPVASILNVKLPVEAFGLDLTILDAHGRRVNRQKVNGQEVSISMNGHPAGLYLVQIGNVAMKKFIIQ